ncbi:protein kinase domain-containing protein [Actinoallomurus sp. CA-150999]|uniref:serine/threonine-protein kinase n=1 Tax=Actinoallomurus sp. CA-150999 TaxID=3239887 RepID=UPI003D8CF1E3
MEGGANKLIGGRYRLSAQVGKGGMGTVWRAWDTVLDREVAVKELILPADLPGDERAVRMQRAIREARSAAGLDHPGIVTVFDMIEHERTPVIVMEFVRGRSLQQIVAAEGPLPPSQVASIGAQMLDALRTAHAAGIVHRDLKPANVLVTDRRVIITDFGIASMTGDSSLTAAGERLGTPAFMAPEQANGMEATPASDLWSLGATLYTCVEGRRPFEGSGGWAVLAAVLTADPPAPLRAGPLTPLLRALLTKDPNARATAADAATFLDAVISGHQATEPRYENRATKRLNEPPVPPAPLGPRRRTSTATVALLGALCLLAVVTVGTVALWADRLHSGHANVAGGSTTGSSTTATGPDATSPASTTGPSAGKATLGVLLDTTYPGPGARIATAGTNGRPAVFPGGPAALVGLQPGDIITVFGGSPVNNTTILVALLQRYAPGDRVFLTYQRNGVPVTTQVVLGR